MLHFAYGSNMSRRLMHARCAGAREIGLAVLEGYRFIIAGDGYASVVPQPGARVHGLLWRLGARHVCALNRYESLDSGLYHAAILPVRSRSTSVPALVYVARSRRPGKPKPGFHDLVLAAARELNLPVEYVTALARWAPGRFKGARAAETGEIA
jgi:gamma-glutamylcyclotransferase (GGCT)/AIG2-like uncharacterized protein YtfP